MRWLPYDDKYQVSDEGYVMNRHNGRILALMDDRRGYDRVDLHNKHRKVHHLVASRFLPAPVEDNLVIDHIDRNRRNNNASNLRWVTTKVNNNNKGMKGVYPFTSSLKPLDPSHGFERIPLPPCFSVSFQ